MSTTRSPECNAIAQKIWQFCGQNNIWITCAYISGSENIFPDIESSKQYKNAEWMLNPILPGLLNTLRTWGGGILSPS